MCPLSKCCVTSDTCLFVSLLLVEQCIYITVDSKMNLKKKKLLLSQSYFNGQPIMV